MSATALIRPMPHSRLDRAVDAALAFVADAHSTTGTLHTQAAPHPSMCAATDLFTVYIPTFVVRALGAAADRPAASSVIASLLRSLVEHRRDDGTWSFFGRTRPDVPADFDDTCCALAAMKLHDGSAEAPVLDLLEQYRDRCGLFYTWLDDAANRRCFYRVDGLVNANVLFYSALHGIELPAIVRYLTSYIRMNRLGHLSLYWTSEYPASYMISRLYRDVGVIALRPAMPELTRIVLARQSRDGGWGSDLDTALATVSLLNSGYRGDHLGLAVQRLRRSQRADGSWPAAAFCQDFVPTYYGSAVLTTSVCIEALVKYLEVMEAKPGENR
jgi:hypothetical protein